MSLPNKVPFTCKVVLIACTCDLPARAQVMNTVQFNGYYGCTFCRQKGSSYLIKVCDILWCYIVAWVILQLSQMIMFQYSSLCKHGALDQTKINAGDTIILFGLRL